MKREQQGFAALTVLLFTLLMFTLVTAMFANSYSTPQTGSQIWGIQTQLVAQANLLRTKLEYCASQNAFGSAAHSSYPSGTAITVTSGASGVPSCPNPSQSLFSGSDGVFLPSPPTGFNAWIYNNVPSGVVKVSIETTGTPNAVTSAALSNAASALGTGASVVNGANSADTLQLIVTN